MTGVVNFKQARRVEVRGKTCFSPQGEAEPRTHPTVHFHSFSKSAIPSLLLSFHPTPVNHIIVSTYYHHYHPLCCPHFGTMQRHMIYQFAKSMTEGLDKGKLSRNPSHSGVKVNMKAEVIEWRIKGGDEQSVVPRKRFKISTNPISL